MFYSNIITLVITSCQCSFYNALKQFIIYRVPPVLFPFTFSFLDITQGSISSWKFPESKRWWPTKIVSDHPRPICSNMYFGRLDIFWMAIVATRGRGITRHPFEEEKRLKRLFSHILVARGSIEELIKSLSYIFIHKTSNNCRFGFSRPGS